MSTLLESLQPLLDEINILNIRYRLNVLTGWFGTPDCVCLVVNNDDFAEEIRDLFESRMKYIVGNERLCFIKSEQDFLADFS